MKKSLVIIVLILLIIIVICVVKLSINNQKRTIQKQSNIEYEQYLNKDIHGTDVITIINKAMYDNEKNNVSKDENGYYIADDRFSISVDLVMITNEEKQEKTTYKMEKINKVGINKFIENFNTENFIITKIEYHKQTGKVKYIEIAEKIN